MKIGPLLAAGIVALQVSQFRGGVDAVRVDVLVADGAKPLADLTADDFEVRDSGIAQRIESVAIADVPISVMIALDTSTSVSGRTLAELKQGVAEVTAMLQPVDRAALITFSSEVRLATDWGGDMAKLGDAVGRLSAGGGTALWDAAFAALAFPDETPTVRRLVLVFSDGDDTSSWLSRAAVTDKARRTDAVVYGVEV
jgi:VWFA-related protein